jgi:uncharacterized protein (DUF433 family)
MARMIPGREVQVGDIVELYGRREAEKVVALKFDLMTVERLGENIRTTLRVADDEWVIVRLRDGQAFGDEDLLHARAMHWS